MKVDLSLEERESLLRQLRIAVALQIELWDITLAMSEQVDCELGEIASGLQAASITADTGLELGFLDLDDFLGIGPSRKAIGHSLSELRTVQ